MNTETNKPLIDGLRIIEVESRTKLDQMVITLSSSFLALIFGFLKDILFYIQYSYWLKILFLVVVLLFTVCITLNVYSHHCSEKLSKEAQSSLAGQASLRAEDYFDKKNRTISRFNNAYLISFVSALFFIFIFIVCSISTFDNNYSTKTLQPSTSFLRKHVMSNNNHLVNDGITFSTQQLLELQKQQNNTKQQPNQESVKNDKSQNPPPSSK